jgi:hypothetical protein
VAVAAGSSGDTLLLGVLLGLAAGRVAAGVAAVLALSSVLIRWGSPSLEALAGAQAVLGPAGTVGTTAAAASAWCAASALVLAAPRPDARLPWRIVAVAPFGIAAAAVVLGAGPGGLLWLRVVASVGAVVLALTITLLPRRLTVAAALGAGAAAVVLAMVA